MAEVHESISQTNLGLEDVIGLFLVLLMESKKKLIKKRKAGAGLSQFATEVNCTEDEHIDNFRNIIGAPHWIKANIYSDFLFR